MMCLAAMSPRVNMGEAQRSWPFCNHTIPQGGALVVSDLSRDDPFMGNPAVTGESGFRFYAGCPVVDGDGFALRSCGAIQHIHRSRLGVDLAAGSQRSGTLRVRPNQTIFRLKWRMRTAGSGSMSIMRRSGPRD
jgi:hypothetical protein